MTDSEGGAAVRREMRRRQRRVAKRAMKAIAAGKGVADTPGGTILKRIAREYLANEKYIESLDD
jgi:hypothetical protein